MAETFSAARLSPEKAARYAELAEEIRAVLEGEPDPIARMATVSSMLAAAFPQFLWTGFYRVDPRRSDELVIGPYQGQLGCLRIAFGRGVCGTSAADRRVLIVPDVDAFEGHIACDSRSRSEIVLPVLDAAGELLGVLDVDSADLATFDETDASGLQSILSTTFGTSTA
ncbi:MAG: GAF domain-containing protein [Caulobacteraceae bacterium]|nr:GAF domain-containing protein [Caulobacteraceae bacterium]